jgi:hypothetical protein
MGTADYAEIQNRLTPLMADGAPFANSARELLGLAAYKAEKYDDARKYLEPLLIDPNVSEDLQNRVKVIMGEIAAAQVAAKTSPAPASSASAPSAPAPEKPAEPAKTEEQPGTGGAAGTEKK